MQNFPIANADAGMASLMTLITIMTTKGLHLSMMVDSDFINRKESKAK